MDSTQFKSVIREEGNSGSKPCNCLVLCLETVFWLQHRVESKQSTVVHWANEAEMKVLGSWSSWNVVGGGITEKGAISKIFVMDHLKSVAEGEL